MYTAYPLAGLPDNDKLKPLSRMRRAELVAECEKRKVKADGKVDVLRALLRVERARDVLYQNLLSARMSTLETPFAMRSAAARAARDDAKADPRIPGAKADAMTDIARQLQVGRSARGEDAMTDIARQLQAGRSARGEDAMTDIARQLEAGRRARAEDAMRDISGKPASRRGFK